MLLVVSFLISNVSDDGFVVWCSRSGGQRDSRKFVAWFFRPFRAFASAGINPGLAPWAAFFRRFAALDPCALDCRASGDCRPESRDSGATDSHGRCDY